MSDRDAVLGRLERRLGHGFTDRGHLQLALTHRSAAANNNERLEFLGDALLGCVIAERLYQAFPQVDEGRLSRMRAQLVRGESLAELSRDLGLGEFLTLGPGELRNGGHARDSTLADALEALIGAIYLDAGVGAAQAFIDRLFQHRIAALNSAMPGKDPKTRLQEWLQARQLPLPEYSVLTITGKAHEQVFKVSCGLTDRPWVCEATGRSRRRAEQAAAKDMLTRLETDPDSSS